MLKKWIYKPTPDAKTVESLAKSLNTKGGNPEIYKVLSKLLVRTGIADFEEARAFFRPDLENLHDPFLMCDMHQAVSRLSEAMKAQEKILIYGDYDVDGTTSVALVYGSLKPYFEAIKYYVPDRYKEGYGISKAGIDYAHSEGITLIIALDCGVRAIDKVAYASTLGIDFIICDHHNPGDELPAAVAVLDPKRTDCAYPFKELTGCGVGLKLLQAFFSRNPTLTFTLEDGLDLVVTSISCDIVPIVGENRVLSYYGLKQINRKTRGSLKALRDEAGLNDDMNIERVVFGFGPRINAAGRIAHASKAIELLLSDDINEALEFAGVISDHNLERKKLDKSITEEALMMIRQDEWLEHEAVSTVLFQPHWHKGVVGIVASRCIEQFYRPTIILTASNGMATGSARSIEDFDLYDAIMQCDHLIEQWGGHTHAAGLTLKVENVPLFQKAFNEVVKSRTTPDLLTPRITIDDDLSLALIDKKLFGLIKQMAPFGPQNMQPVFSSTAVLIVPQSVMIMKKIHLKFQVACPDTGVVFSAVGFGMAAAFAEKLKTAKTCSIAYTISENSFRDTVSLQLMLKDIRF